MTKADRIRALYAEGRSVAEIAEIVGCLQEYVRVAARQRKDGAGPADKKYAARKLAMDNTRFAFGDRAAARLARRAAYRAARDRGLSSSEAARITGGVYTHMMRRTGLQFIRTDGGEA